MQGDERAVAAISRTLEDEDRRVRQAGVSAIGCAAAQGDAAVVDLPIVPTSDDTRDAPCRVATVHLDACCMLLFLCSFPCFRTACRVVRADSESPKTSRPPFPHAPISYLQAALGWHGPTRQENAYDVF